jgi:hypothetical protein
VDQIGGDARSQASALRSLDRERPLLAIRLRLALRAPNAAARLAHCWALIELLNPNSPSANG